MAYMAVRSNPHLMGRCNYKVEGNDEFSSGRRLFIPMSRRCDLAGECRSTAAMQFARPPALKAVAKLNATPTSSGGSVSPAAQRTVGCTCLGKKYVRAGTSATERIQAEA